MRYERQSLPNGWSIRRSYVAGKWVVFDNDTHLVCVGGGRSCDSDKLPPLRFGSDLEAWVYALNEGRVPTINAAP